MKRDANLIVLIARQNSRVEFERTLLTWKINSPVKSEEVIKEVVDKE